MRIQFILLRIFALLLITLIPTDSSFGQDSPEGETPAGAPRHVNPQRIEQRLHTLEIKVAELDKQTDELRHEFNTKLERIETIRAELSQELLVLTAELLGDESPAARASAAQAIVLDGNRQDVDAPPSWTNRIFSFLMLIISVLSIGFILKIFFARWGAEDAVELIEQSSGYIALEEIKLPTSTPDVEPEEPAQKADEKKSQQD